MVNLLVFMSFLSVVFVCFLMAWIQWYISRCPITKGKHNWKRVSEKYYGNKVIPDTIILHLKCENCGKEITKTYQI